MTTYIASIARNGITTKMATASAEELIVNSFSLIYFSLLPPVTLLLDEIAGGKRKENKQARSQASPLSQLTYGGPPTLQGRYAQ